MIIYFINTKLRSQVNWTSGKQSLAGISNTQQGTHNQLHERFVTPLPIYIGQ